MGTFYLAPPTDVQGFLTSQLAVMDLHAASNASLSTWLTTRPLMIMFRLLLRGAFRRDSSFSFPISLG